MSDGVRLAAGIWPPEGADLRPVPAILRYIPYRRRNSIRARDGATYSYFAGHDYACMGLDIRCDGVHQVGGCLLGDNLSGASTMYAYNARLPDPGILGDDWRDIWMQRPQGSGKIKSGTSPTESAAN
jgi:hypothetical protein